jgi:hypothetical protein
MSAFEELMKHFPPVEMSFAYGSGVFRQAGYEDVSVAPGSQDFSKLPMLDLVFAVRDPLAWHTANLDKNRGHYSGLRYFGPEIIAMVQGGWCSKQPDLRVPGFKAFICLLPHRFIRRRVRGRNVLQYLRPLAGLRATGPDHEVRRG